MKSNGFSGLKRYLCIIMERTFRQRVTLAGIVMSVVPAALAMSFFWQRDATGAFAGFCLAMLTVVVIDRVLHTEYVFSGDTLTVSRGRFARKTVVRLGEITRVRMMHQLFVRYVLIEYGAGHSLSAQPDNAEAFIEEINKRIGTIE